MQKNPGSPTLAKEIKSSMDALAELIENMRTSANTLQRLASVESIVFINSSETKASVVELERVRRAAEGLLTTIPLLSLSLQGKIK